jgi:hypothetical protein
MTQRKDTTIKQGALADVMARLSELPNRDKDPGTAVSLAEIFRTREYLAEIKGALKKGYTFENLAEIFTERCGVAVSARQLKYHYTREKNRKTKNNVAGKPEGQDTSKGDATPENPAQMDSSDGAERDIGVAANVPPIHVPEPVAFATANGEVVPSETGAFFFDKRL